MNYTFFLSQDCHIVETQWYGELSGEILCNGAIDREIWIQKNCKKTPSVLLSDYTNANLVKITVEDLKMVVKKFYGIENRLPGVKLIGIMSSDLKYGFARMWQAYAEPTFNNSHVVRSRIEAQTIISNAISNHM